MFTLNCYKSYHKLYTSGQLMQLFLAQYRFNANNQSSNLLNTEEVEKWLYWDSS